jgi:CarboxypepD_reg-like domain
MLWQPAPSNEAEITIVFKQYFYMKTILTSCLLLLTSVLSAQDFTLTGTVMDSATRQPLDKASVYCQNTTFGTATNNEGAFKLTLKNGGYNLIVTFTGYKTQQLRIGSADNNKLEILMTKEEKGMDEVIIKSSNEVKDGWEKYGAFFKEQFIGATKFADSCTLLNPEALKFYFYKKSNKLKVMATEPVKIANRALGYNLSYRLDSFMYYYKTEAGSYRGFCFYEEMPGSADEIKKWKTNRNKAYLGSRLHFMRSYYDSTLKEDGWILEIPDEKNEKFVKVKEPYDSMYYGFIDSTKDVELDYPGKLQVTYMKGGGMEKAYLKKYKLPDVNVQTSFLDFMNGIVIQQNGYFYEQKDIVNQGYWSWKNLADQLPYNYELE